MRGRWIGVIAAIAAAALVGGYCRAQQSPAERLKEADKLFEEKSYAGAVKAYQALSEEKAVPEDRRDEVAYRTVVSLGKTKQWDAAIAQSLAFVKSHQGTVWEPRGLYWLGRLYVGATHRGYRVGDKFYRGDDVPQHTDQKPEPVYEWTQRQIDFGNALDAFEAARVLFPSFRAANHTESEEIQLDFDLANLLAHGGARNDWARTRTWKVQDETAWLAPATMPYQLDWPLPRKVFYLYDNVQRLAGSLHDTHNQALALFARALWLREYHATMESLGSRWDPEQKKVVVAPYPCQSLTAESVLQELIRKYPDDPAREQAEFTLGQNLEQNQKLVEAVEVYRKFVAEHPHSKWAVDANERIKQITKPNLTTYATNTTKIEEPITCGVDVRNAAAVHLALYRVDLLKLLAGGDALAQTNDWNQLNAYIGTGPSVPASFGKPVAEWDETVTGTEDHQSHRLDTKLPVNKIGTYVIVASHGDARSANLVILTDITIVQQSHNRGVQAFVADARSGKPVSGAKVVTRYWWGNMQTGSAQNTTDRDGIARNPQPAAAGRDSYWRAASVAAIGERCAATSPDYFVQSGSTANGLEAHITTDRAVYRPSQTAHFRATVFRRSGHDLLPAANQSLSAYIYPPQSAQCRQMSLTTDAFGVVTGEVTIPVGAKLGEWHVSLAADGRQFGNGSFGVEEYKKPEFQVTVTPAASRIRWGQNARATISARYYFGGPVADAKVTYRVYRDYFNQYHHFPQPFDFLWSGSIWHRTARSYDNTQPYAQGEARTDASGNARISFATGVDQPGYLTDESYMIVAEVQDASRRVIEGSGELKATHKDVAAFLNFAHGYATQGDRLDVEVLTLNPADLPVSVKGKARVYRIERGDAVAPNKPKETLLHEEALTTDSHGRAYLRWTADTSGYMRVEFSTMDSAEQPVTGETRLFVDGPELAKGRFLYQSVFLASKTDYYEEGQQAKMLVVTPEPDCDVLLTRQADNQIMETRLVHVPGRSAQITLPISHADAPNFHVSAVLVRNGKCYEGTDEIFVPPTRSLLNVTVASAKTSYQPGETASFLLTAKDNRGRPVRGEFAMAVSDAALDYIRTDSASDIRRFFFGRRRSRTVRSANSQAVGWGPVDLGPVQTPVTLHQWVQPEGMGLLAEWPVRELAYRGDYWYVTWGEALGPSAFGGGYGASFGGSFRPIASDRSSLLSAGAIGGGRNVAAKGLSGPQGAAESEPARTEFKDTAFWSPSVMTGSSGKARLRFTWPDNLTRWTARVVGNTATAQVGQGDVEVTTRKDILVRLQAPRFFVERDAVVLSANVHNYTKAARDISVRLDLGTNNLAFVPRSSAAAERYCTPDASERADTVVTVPASGQKRVDWVVRTRAEGTATIKMSARCPAGSDAVQLSFPVLVHGVERATAQGGVLSDGSEARVTLTLPEARKPGSSELVVQLNPSLAGVMLDALPYLTDYPYGCIEQTMSRFVPTVVVAKALKESGIDLPSLKAKLQRLQEEEASPGGSKPVANSAYTYASGRPGRSNYARYALNVPTGKELDAMIAESLERVQNWQHSDGGWSWWQEGASDPYMTAYVLSSLLTARDSGRPVDDAMVDRASAFLRRWLLEGDNLHRMAYEAQVLSRIPDQHAAIHDLVAGRLYERREQLNAYSKALLAMALNNVGEKEKARTLLRNMESTLQVDEANGTANWQGLRAYWWYWWNNGVQTNAAALEAYMQIEPGSRYAPMVARWLVNNRRGAVWQSTRETADAVLALVHYARAKNELAANYTLTVDLGGRIRRGYTVTPETALLMDRQFIVPDELLKTGAQTLTLTKRGSGSVYYTAYLRYFSLEEPISPAGNEIAVARRYFLLRPKAPTPPATAPAVPDVEHENPFLTRHYEVLEGGEATAKVPPAAYDRVPLADGAVLESGDLLEVEVDVEAKNEYDYVAFEDMKPAGCEPIERQSGYKDGIGLWSYVEMRDQKVAFFVDHLPQGRRTLTYRLRAETPGQYHALPTHAYAMYAPEVSAISGEQRMAVR